MKVLHISYSDIEGGAARAAYRLHLALKSFGIDSLMLVVSKKTNDATVLVIQDLASQILRSMFKNIDRLCCRIYFKRKKKNFNFNWFAPSSIVTKIKKLKPDVIHLHWICDGAISIGQIGKLDIPIVWSLHDSWPFTGGCHVPENCMNYVSGCGDCPTLNSSNRYDLSRLLAWYKAFVFGKINNIYINGLSKWIANSASKSYCFRNKYVFNIPNLLDKNIFRSIDQTDARRELGLPLNKKIVLFGAMNATKDKNKGFDYFVKALNFLKISNTAVVIFGDEHPPQIDGNHEVYSFGKINDDSKMVLLYSSADVLVSPSVQENLSNVIMESMFCGTPVVGFNIGGNSDLIIHRVNGYLANPFDVSEFAKGIDFFLNNNNPKEIRKKTKDHAHSKFDSNVVVKRYLTMYENVRNV